MNEYIYCNVLIKNKYAGYSYISDDEKIAVGDYVVVPFGKQDEECFGEVIACGRYNEDSVPFPAEKTKHIIRTASADEYENAPTVPTFSDNDIEAEFCQLDEYIDNEEWNEVLDWANRNIDSMDEKTAHRVIRCYELCLEQNIPVAALNLGTFYYNGIFLKQDYKEAFRLYKIAADAGILRAICDCGYCFYYGRHQAVDYCEAKKYFTLGALLFDDPNCLYKLGDMYANGYGTEKNEQYAYLLYERAMNRCEEWNSDDFCLADTQFRVGKCLLYGIGTGKNIESAQEHLGRALNNFYKRRRTDPFVSGLISNTHKMLREAQEILDAECL